MTRAEVAQRDRKMQAQRCYRHCGGCGGCRAYDGGLMKCERCAPIYRRCRCGEGIRVSLREDGLIQISDFGTLGKGHRVDRPIVRKGPAVAEPVRRG